MSTLVMKFGGTSIGSPHAITQVAQILVETAPQWDRIILVVSAISGVTNALLQSAQAAQSGDEQTYTAEIDHLRDLHRQTIRTLLPNNGERTPLLATISSLVIK